MLCMNKQLHDWLQIYLHKIRPQFALKDESALFIKVTGDAFPEGTIGKRIAAFFSKMGIRRDIRVSSTRIRKLISSTVHEHHPENAAKVRKLMAHSQKTAELSYVRSSLTQTAPAAHEVVSTVLGASSSSSVARSLTAKEKDAIDLQFRLFITLNKKVCLKDVQHKIKHNSTLRPLAVHGEMVKKVLDRIRYQQSAELRVRPEELVASDPMQETSNWVQASSVAAASTTSTSLRSRWMDEDTQTITSCFTRLYDKCPSKADIQLQFESTDELAEILEREGWTRCYEKVKSIMKKKVRSVR